MGCFSDIKQSLNFKHVQIISVTLFKTSAHEEVEAKQWFLLTFDAYSRYGSSKLLNMAPHKSATALF